MIPCILLLRTCGYVTMQKDEGATLGPTIKKHIIQVSTHQMSILMLFNKRTTLSFQVSTSLHTRTG